MVNAVRGRTRSREKGGRDGVLRWCRKVWDHMFWSNKRDVEGVIMVARGILGLALAPFLLIGAWCSVDPVGALQDVAVTALDSRGEVELRAMYGGLQLGMAAWLSLQLNTEERARRALVVAGSSIGGMGIVRSISWVVFQPTGWLLPFLCVIELLAPVLAGVGYFASSNGRTSQSS